MSTLTTPADLGTFLGLDAIDTDRAQLLLDIVEGDAAGVVSPLPATAMGVILTAAARGYANPDGVVSSSTGAVNASYGTGGLYLTRAERRTLRRLAGVGAGAFTIDPTPADAMADYIDPLAPPTVDDAEQLVLDQPDPFITP